MTVRHVRVDSTMNRIAIRCDVIATQIPTLRAHLLNERTIADGHAAHGERVGGRSSSELTPTEASASAAMLAQAKLDQLNDDLQVLDSLTTAMARMVNQDLRWRVPTEAITVQLCDGQHLEGATLAWTPGSQNPLNGWHDPLCRTIAELNKPLCIRCLRRCNRWRADHELAALGERRKGHAA